VVWDTPYSTPDWRLPTGNLVGPGATLPDRGVVLHASPSLKALGTTVATTVGDGVTTKSGIVLGLAETQLAPPPHAHTIGAGTACSVAQRVNVPRGLKAAGCPP
jgi:hypothetical protein